MLGRTISNVITNSKLRTTANYKMIEKWAYIKDKINPEKDYPIENLNSTRDWIYFEKEILPMIEVEDKMRDLI